MSAGETGPEPKTIHRRFAIALLSEALAGTGEVHLDYRVDREPETIHVWQPRKSANDCAPPAPPDPDPGRRFSQAVLSAAMEHGGMEQVPVEIAGEPDFIDLYFEPARSTRGAPPPPRSTRGAPPPPRSTRGAPPPPRPRPRARGLLHRMTRRRCNLSPMHETPEADDVRYELFHTFNLWRARGQRNEGVPSTWQIFTEGSTELLKGFGMDPKDGWPRGVYYGPPIYELNMVVLSELDPTPDTLLLRLLGTGPLLENALEEQAKLPDGALERRATLAALRAVNPRPGEPIPFAKVSARDPALRACRQIYTRWAKRISG